MLGLPAQRQLRGLVPRKTIKVSEGRQDLASAGSKGAGASTQPAYTLELRAADQRRQIHSSVTEFRSQLREKLDVKRNVRAHLPVLSGAAAVFALLAVDLLVIPRRRPRTWQIDGVARRGTW